MIAPETFCEVCKRVKWGQWQVLPFGKWRHAECYAGSKEWLAYYATLTAPTNEQKYIFNAQQVKTEPETEPIAEE
jgi:hypothetical protein